MVTDFGRVLTAMVTPFDSEMQVDYGKARKLARYLVENGSDGIVVAGTTGESPTLTNEERNKLVEAVVNEVGDRAKVIVGTGNNDTFDSMGMTKDAEKTGAHGVMAVVPYYNKPPQEGLYNHFRMIAESTNLPVILYNIPGRSAINMNAETIARLAQIDNIVAIKEAAGSMDQVSEIRRSTPADFIIYSGDDSLTLPMLALGAHGIISVVSHVVGNELQQMIGAFLGGDLVKATQIHMDLFPVFKTMFLTSNPIPVKTCLNLMGHEVGGMRPPLLDATEAEVATLKALLQKYNKL
ncbi:MAG: 4-hydroxy-tetrahydrodipicolinate synthase [Thermincola sp.]|nr:4-hydroxy-tetrahydrodipicolinate synthase [Thermincola sp.]MDT3701707.1 4-hydroxy-tetrahydrodipicolinate synthase [Thermincola sp.]